MFKRVNNTSQETSPMIIVAIRTTCIIFKAFSVWSILKFGQEPGSYLRQNGRK